MGDRSGALELGEDFSVPPISGSGPVAGPVTFCGYGITAPERKRDDYRRCDARGKVVLVLRYAPNEDADEAHGAGSKGVLEVRTHDTPFLLEHGQIVARLVYEPLTERPSRLYGEGGSHYQRQGLKLSKHFRPWG